MGLNGRRWPFLMASSPLRASARVMDWAALRSFATEEIVQCLQSSPELGLPPISASNSIAPIISRTCPTGQPFRSRYLEGSLTLPRPRYVGITRATWPVQHCPEKTDDHQYFYPKNVTTLSATLQKPLATTTHVRCAISYAISMNNTAR
jgi:hypothetical protein